MATNKNAILRFNVLDKCFRNLGRTYSFEDLLDTVNEALTEEDPSTTGIKTRQLRDDIRFMKSEAGYGAPIVTEAIGRQRYYRYEDSKFSINNSPITATESEQLRSVLQLLKRFDGTPGFEWVSELTNLARDKFSLSNHEASVISYETNVDYSGYKWISVLFNAIVNQQVLNVSYQPFGKESFTLTFHPYFLKQYNSRWFAYGLNDELGIDTWNLALDRIVEASATGDLYKPSEIDWEDYFYDFIGPTKTTDKEVEDVHLLFRETAVNYVLTKPLHPSQRNEELTDGSLIVKLKLIPNYELETVILGFGDKVEVLIPVDLRKRISERLFNASNQYNK